MSMGLNLSRERGVAFEAELGCFYKDEIFCLQILFKKFDRDKYYFLYFLMKEGRVETLPGLSYPRWPK